MTIKGFFVGIIKFTLLIISLMLVGALSTFVTIRLFTAGDEVVVPDLTGKDPVETLQIVKDHSLQLKVQKQKRYSDKVAADHVVAQNPGPRQKIKQGRSIEVYLSLGPEKAIVPDLAGQTARVATMTLEQRGLQQGRIIYVTSPASQPDEVLAQFPVKGTELTGTRAVDILVNSAIENGPVYVMPDVIGRNIEEISGAFRRTGLRVGVSQPVEYPGVEAGTIVKQNPPAGYKVTADTFIGLYYSK
jgi:eukaryotic-like serine/threonine-protein kinase